MHFIQIKARFDHARAHGKCSKIFIIWLKQCKLLPSDRIAYFVSGPNSIAKSVIEPDNNGRYTVYYTPVEVGLYSIAIKWNGKEIEGKWVSAYFWMSPCAVCSLHHRLIVHIFKSQLA